MMKSPPIAIVLTAAALLLAGCGNPFNMKNTPYGEAFRWQTEVAWTEDTILRHGWTESKTRKTSKVPAVYCYSTIGEPDCYRSPRPGQAARMVGYMGPPPM